MPSALNFTLNGRTLSVAGCSPNLTLLEYLRRHGLTGSKEGCAEGDCGACSVAILDHDADGRPCYRAINSCLVPLSLLAGREIISVEGVGAPGKLHPVQEQMVRCHGSQCGYCTPGFVLSLFEGYYRESIKTSDQLDDQLSGNLCRCTGYRSIRSAAINAFPQRHAKNGKDSFAERLKKPVPKLSPAEYDFRAESFYRPATLVQLLNDIRRHPEARLIAGATELGLDISKRFKRFPRLISVEAVPELKQIKTTRSEWHIGAAVTLTEIEERMAAEFPALARMLRVFGSRQIRNRATMGGNLVTASPIGDSAPVLLALDASVVLASLAEKASTKSLSPNGQSQAEGAIVERTLPLAEFFVAYRKTALRTSEVLKTIIVPRAGPAPGRKRFCEWFKVSKRREMDISTVAACLLVEVDRTGIVRHARLAYGGVAALPSRALKTERALVGTKWDSETIDRLSPILAAEFTPISDVRGGADYRRELVTALFQKFYQCTLATDEPDPGDNARLFPVVEPKQPAFRPHESAHKHVTGEALYTDDQAATRPMLEAWPICSPHARARILRRDATAARAMPGIKAVLLAEDIPGVNDVGTKGDEPLFAIHEVHYHSQMVALVVGESLEACRAAAAAVTIDYEPLPPIVSLRQALAANSFHNEPNYIRRADVEPAFARAPHILEGEFELGGQEHFYLETQAAWAEPGEDAATFVSSSTQHPSEVQLVVAHLLHAHINKVVVQSPRMGGGFGGKETQAAIPAALAALAAHHTRQPVRVRFNRDQDMAITGHRHPFLARFKVGFDDQGRLLAARVHLCSDGGWALDLSQAVTDRALFHLDNAYYIPAVEFRGQVAKTNLSSNTAFRGFGGPQGMLVMEEIVDRIARRIGRLPEAVRQINLYHDKGETNTTHYGQELGDNRIPAIWEQLKRSSELLNRRRQIARWNRNHPHRKRGIAITPVKFGISFTVTHLNQAGALVLLYQDGTVQVNHGGTEMGQGVHTNIIAIAAGELGVPAERVRVMPTSTDKVPNTSATAASCGTDLNGAAVQNACQTLRERLIPIATQLLGRKLGRGKAPRRLTFANGAVYDAANPTVKIAFADLVRKAYLERVSLSATGFYCTPNIHWDRVRGHGKPFHYFAYGAAVAEVEVDGFTGMHRVLRVDIVHDVGDSINAAVNRGQIEGGFVQGMGWLTNEELIWDDLGRLLTHSPDTYKIPSVGDTPRVFNVTLLKNAAQKGVVHGSKAVGEPPLMLAISVREAIRDAIGNFGAPGGEVPLASPATCEAIFSAIRSRSAAPVPNLARVGPTRSAGLPKRVSRKRAPRVSR
jgi:xanthine dehydrogenase molybdopterin binding subunit/xanthine dehydrogenase small subunit